MRDSIFPEYLFSKRYVLDQYKTNEMCDKAVDYCLATLKLVPYWFVTSKIIKIVFTDFYTDESILYFNEDSDNVVIICNGMGIFDIDLNNINLDNTNYDKDNPDIIILSILSALLIKSEKLKKLKKR